MKIERHSCSKHEFSPGMYLYFLSSQHISARNFPSFEVFRQFWVPISSSWASLGLDDSLLLAIYFLSYPLRLTQLGNYGCFFLFFYFLFPFDSLLNICIGLSKLDSGNPNIPLDGGRDPYSTLDRPQLSPTPRVGPQQSFSNRWSPLETSPQFLLYRADNSNGIS